MKDCISMTSNTSRLYKQNPHETVFALFCFASHGMIQDGRQVILVNELNQIKGFYKFYGAEENMRTAARSFSNAYIVGIFACCREIFLVTQHSGCISLAQKKELDEQKRLRDKRRAERLVKLIQEQLAKIVHAKHENLNNDLRQKAALIAIHDDRQKRLD